MITYDLMNKHVSALLGKYKNGSQSEKGRNAVVLAAYRNRNIRNTTIYLVTESIGSGKERKLNGYIYSNKSWSYFEELPFSKICSGFATERITHNRAVTVNDYIAALSPVK